MGGATIRGQRKCFCRPLAEAGGRNIELHRLRYRYQLEAFVDKVRGRSQANWHDPAKSISEVETIERVYVKVNSSVLLATPNVTHCPITRLACR